MNITNKITIQNNDKKPILSLCDSCKAVSYKGLAHCHYCKSGFCDSCSSCMEDFHTGAGDFLICKSCSDISDRMSLDEYENCPE